MNRFSSLSLIVCALLAGGASSSPAQEWAKAKLEQSERHREYVPVKHDGRTINTLVAVWYFSRPTLLAASNKAAVACRSN